ncbi:MULTISPECIES: hypothetical protein [unclassified Novosphingobium]|uniref:hypothetical protein n=1 Tax=unclassified Novosphingobium TaxID=2644732 RepID=UPI0013569F99|nr:MULTISPECIES: hypothetical protein [unclassified Novosphingobium]
MNMFAPSFLAQETEQALAAKAADVAGIAPLGLSDIAIASIVGEDAAYEARALDRGWLKPGESYGYKAIFRSLTTGAPTNESPTHRNRIDALIAAHTNTTPGLLFERIEVVRTAFAGRAAA